MPISYHHRPLKSNRKLEQRLEAGVAPSSFLRGYLYPSGRITVGRIPKPKITADDRRYENTRQEYGYTESTHWDYDKGLVREYSCYPKGTPLLGLSDISNCHKTKTRRHGLKGLPRRGKYRVLEGASILQRKFGKKVGFYTLTCPYTEETLIYEFNKCFGEIMRRFFQELRREYNRRGVTYSYVAVYEIQTDRYRDTSIPVLHVHWVSPCYFPNTYTFVLTADEIRDIYRRVLSTVVSPLSTVGSALDAQVVKKSVTGYLAKYLSKGGEMIGDIADASPSQLPSKWWSMSRNVLQCLKKTTLELTQDVSELLLYGQQSIQSLVAFLYYIKRIYIPSPLGDICVGIAATATPQFADTLRPMTTFCVLDELL